MKVALVQDWLVVDGGAEKVLREIVNMYEDIDIFALVDFLDEKDRNAILKGKKSKTSFIQYLPFAKKAYRNYLPLFPTAIESLDFSGYDLIISSSYAVAKGIITKGDQVHICYCHSPIRYAWDLENEYLANTSGIKKYLIQKVLKYIRKWDIHTAGRVHLFIANSNYIAERIKRIYNRESIVLYPPVDTFGFSKSLQKENYYMTSSRMVAYKKIDLIIQVFNDLPHLKLVISGDGPEFSNLKKLAKSENIHFTGFLKKEELVTTLQKAKAFILAANEDFGITSIEAQSCCTPVIALKKGGYLETVVEGKTGLFFDEQTASSLHQAILKFEALNYSFKESDFISNIEKFSVDKFRSGFKNIANKYAKGKSS